MLAGGGDVLQAKLGGDVGGVGVRAVHGGEDGVQHPSQGDVGQCTTEKLVTAIHQQQGSPQEARLRPYTCKR